MQNMSAREPDAAAPGWRRHRLSDGEARHVVWRIGGPALPADVVVKMGVAVGNDIKAGQFLIADETRYGVFVLLAEAAAHHRFEEMPGAEVFRVPAGTRQRTRDGRRQNDVFGGAIHGPFLPVFL